MPKVPKAKTTVPMSPAISKPKPQSHDDHLPSPAKIIRANPIPDDLDHPFRPRLEHRKIEPTDFSLPGDEISLKKKKEFEEAVAKEQVMLKEASEFHANPLPLDNVPVIIFKSLTLYNQKFRLANTALL